MSKLRSNNEITKFFRKKLLEVDRVDSLDASIDIGKDPNREKILVHILEQSNITSKEHFFVLDEPLKIGSSTIKNQIFLLDDEADEEQFEVFYDGHYVNIKLLSNKACCAEFNGMIKKKRYITQKNETVSISNNDSICFGKTILIFELFSNRTGILKNRNKENNQ